MYTTRYKINKKSIKYLLNTFYLKKNCIISVLKSMILKILKLKTKKKFILLKYNWSNFLTEKKVFKY